MTLADRAGKTRRSPPASFKIAHSYTAPDHCHPNHKPEDHYAGIVSEVSPDDEYTANTLDRYESDPYARPINPLSTGEPVVDRNADKLDKDPEGLWLTAPLVYLNQELPRKLHLLGFVSADAHRYDPGTGRHVRSDIRWDSPQLAFQRCAVDLVTHLIALLVRDCQSHSTDQPPVAQSVPDRQD